MKRDIIDRLMEFVAPGRAVERYKNKAVIGRMAGRKYDAAAKGRRTSDWFAPNTSANLEINYAIKWLRQRSRDLIRNNPYAKNAAYRLIPNNVVGTGIIPTPKISGKSNSKLNDRLKNSWSTWGEKIVCDFDGRNNFYGIQLLVMKAIAESGECIIRRVRTSSDKKIPLQLQVLEGDFIDTTKTDFKLATDFVAKGDYFGIRFDDNGQRIGYWLYNNHPGEFGGVSYLVDAKDVIHVYEVERPGQIRGVPFNSASVLRLRDLDKFEDTELVRQMVAASYAVFKTKDGTGDENNSSSNDLEHIEPGMIYDLLPGENISLSQPPSSPMNYEPYTKSVLRSIAAGHGVTYEGMTGDLSNVNFSSGRMGWLEFQRNVNHWQWNVLVPHLCDTVYAWFVEAAQLAGVVPFGVDVPVTWTPPRREMIDPLKELQAIKLQMRLGIISWQDIVRMFGYIPDELREELKEDKKMWDDLELMPEGDPRFDSNRPPEETLDEGDGKPNE